MPPRDLPSADEIRMLVERVIDGVGSAPSASPAEPAEHALKTGCGCGCDGGAVAIGADHGGFPLKERLAFRLREAGRTVVDCGTDSTEAVDYPDFAQAVAEKVASGECVVGIVIDGAGIGSCMVANKVPGVRAALCYDLSSARNSREHNHANVLTLGAGLIGDGLAWQIVQEWLATPWGEGRHARRVAMIDALDQGRQHAGAAS
ncbi:MAG TPA: ribose 5-phosphate isomerase B [Acidimicrobiia bacterium]|nr:ribose 5-phosphate isomerase B [Acidimicrobiia bacterium]